MTSHISLRVTLLGLALMLLAAVGATASNVDNARRSGSAVVAVAPSGVAVMGSSNIASVLFEVSNDLDRDRNKKRHVATPEPASWLYIVGAALLVLLWERKSLRSLFSN